MSTSHPSEQLSVARVLAVLWRSTHPGPTLVVTALAIALGIVAELDTLRLGGLALSVVLGQISIGLSNDAIDSNRDRIAGRRDKPLALANAPVSAAWIVAGSSAVLAILLSAALSWACALAHAVFLACGWLYNAGLKSTVFSAACFVVGFGVFPSVATLAAPVPLLAPAWQGIAGGVLGLAVHFSNVLPDLDDDARTGVRGLPHRIGARGSVVVAFSALVLGALTIALSTGNSPPGWISGWLGFGAVLSLSFIGVSRALRARAGRGAFRLVMLGALVLATLLVISAAISR